MLGDIGSNHPKGNRDNKAFCSEGLQSKVEPWAASQMSKGQAGTWSGLQLSAGPIRTAQLSERRSTIRGGCPDLRCPSEEASLTRRVKGWKAAQSETKVGQRLEERDTRPLPATLTPHPGRGAYLKSRSAVSWPAFCAFLVYRSSTSGEGRGQGSRRPRKGTKVESHLSRRTMVGREAPVDSAPVVGATRERVLDQRQVACRVSGARARQRPTS